MYDWQRREDTKNLLRHDQGRNDKMNGATVSNKQKSGINGNGMTPSKQNQQYHQHHLNISSNIFNAEGNEKNVNMSAEKNIRPRSNRTYDHSPIFGFERSKTEQNEDNLGMKNEKLTSVRNTNTFSSSVFQKSQTPLENSSSIKIKDVKNNSILQTEKNRNASNKSQFTLGYKQTNDGETDKFFQNKKRVGPADNNIFKPLTPNSAKQNQYKIRDHTTAELFGEVPQECVKRPLPIPYEPLYSQREEIPAQRKHMQFYASRDDNGDFIPTTARVERCHTTHEMRESGSGNEKSSMNGSTSEAAMRSLTPSMKKQMHILGSFSEYKQPSFINKNKQQLDKFKNEIRSYNDEWWNKVESAKNNVHCFLSNKQIADKQKIKQLKSDFFEEINNQIFGGVKDINDPNSITAEEIGVLPITPQPLQQQQQKKWQHDTLNNEKRRKDQNYSDLFGFGESQAPPKNFKDECLFPANFQSNKYDSIKYQTDFPSANLEYGKRPEQLQQEKLGGDQIKTARNNQNQADGKNISLKADMNSASSDQKFYANLSSCLDSNGYNNNYSKNDAWKDEKNLKFDKFKLTEKKTEDQHNASINFGCTKNDEGKNQRIIEIDFKNFSEKFDQSDFKRYCSRKGIHLVDFQYDFNKVNNKIAGTGFLKIRDIHQDTNRIENVKDHLRQQGLVIKNSRVALTTSSGNHSTGIHLPHKSSLHQVDSPSSSFNPNITPQQELILKGKINKKNVESKGFKLLVTKKKKINAENEVSVPYPASAQKVTQNKNYDIARSEIDTAKKLVENHKWKKAIDGVQKESKRNQEIRAKSALVNRKVVTIVE